MAKTINYMESFPTIDLCVDYLERVLGVNWDYDKEQKLRKNHSYQHKDTIVFYDQYNLLSL